MSSTSTSLSSLVAKAQSVKAQSLATLMAALNEVQAVSATSGNSADNPQASLQSAEAQVKATMIAVDANGKALLNVNGTTIEAQLPPHLMEQGATNPDLLKPGAQLRLPADVPARILPSPATRVDVHGQTQGVSVGPAPALASPFPNGSLGAAVSRLAGLALPGAEPEVAPALAQALPPPPAIPPALRPGMIAQAVQPEILTALVQAAGKQVPLAQGLSFLLSLPPEALQTLPKGVQDVVKTLAQLRSPPADLATPEGLAKAVASSGTFLEAHLAALPQQGGAATLPPDFKALLLNLKALVGAQVQGQLQPSGGGGMANAATLILGEALVKPAPGLPPTLEGEAELPLPNPAPVASASTRAEPHAPGARTPAQAAAPALEQVQRAVEGAVERIKLSQIASLPEHPEITLTDGRVAPMRLALSLPLAPHGQERPNTAVMGMVIEHRPATEKPQPYTLEDEAGSPETAAFPWKVRIALDLEDTGPVQAEIALRGQSVGVTLWAERSSTADSARAGIGELHRALTHAAFDVVSLEVKDGFPHQRRAMAASPLLDRRT